VDLSASRVLVACVGNVLLGDDGFGVAVARRLSARTWPEGVHVRDFGIRGFDFVCALLEGYAATILVDAVTRGGPPGRLYVFEPDCGTAPDPRTAGFDPHRMDPARVLGLVRAMGGRVGLFRVVGCEPAVVAGEDEPRMGLTEAVEAAVGPAVEIVARLVADSRVRTLERSESSDESPDGEVAHA